MATRAAAIPPPPPPRFLQKEKENFENWGEKQKKKKRFTVGTNIATRPVHQKQTFC